MYRSLYVFLLSLAILSSGAGDLPARNPSGEQFEKAVYYDPSVDDPAPGQFKKAVYYAAGQRPYKVVAVSLTQSGNLDLAVADYLSNQVCILLGKGDGTFRRSSCFPSSFPIGIASGDFNEDGNLDLVVVEDVGTGNGSIATFLGDGKGRFKLSASYSLGPVSVSVAVADFNGDGHLDVAVTNKGFSGPGNLMTLFGDGHGKLRSRKTYKVAGAPFGIAAADLNGDRPPISRLPNSRLAPSRCC